LIKRCSSLSALREVGKEDGREGGREGRREGGRVGLVSNEVFMRMCPCNFKNYLSHTHATAAIVMEEQGEQECVGGEW